MAENTFLGLQPYTEDDAYRFKGRTEESQELFRLIVRNDFTVCYAESGEGKTSLLNAGVFPLLRENMYFPIAITFTSDDYQVTPDNFSTIIDRCIKDSITEYNEKNKGINVEYRLCSTDFQDLDCQAELQEELSKYSWWKLRNYKPQAMGLTFTPVFVFDQFEEVFNMPGSIVWTKKFFDWLEDVSSDSCPDEIAEKIRAIIGTNAAFPAIKEEKDFKAVFSLRKEFIGELDYWGMQKCFIPSLKDNRYCLKALTYEGAKKVMTQQERFDEEKVEQILTHFVRQYSREPEKTIKEQLPIIPALLLSVVCDSWEKDIDFFSDENEIDLSLNRILENFYNNAISLVVKDLGKLNKKNQLGRCRNDLNSALFALVDGNGKRERAKSTSVRFKEMEFDSKFKNVLIKNRIIKVTKIDGEDYVELVHDCLCPTIVKQRKEQQEKLLKETELKEQQRTDITSSFFLFILLAYFLWQILGLFHSAEFTEEIKTYLWGDTSTNKNLILLGVSVINMLILPIMIYTLIRRSNLAAWFSSYGVLSNLFLTNYLFSNGYVLKNYGLTLASVPLGISVISLVYSFRYQLFGRIKKTSFSIITSSLPLLSFYFIVACFLFYLCIFDVSFGLPVPSDSFWGILVIPILFFRITKVALRISSKKVISILLFLLLGLLSYNSYDDFSFKLLYIFVICFVVFVLLICAFDISIKKKKFLSVFSNIGVLLLVLFLNLGFNIVKIEYDSVVSVNNWRTAVIKKDNHYGLLNACSGDTILPFVFDSVYMNRFFYCNAEDSYRELNNVGGTIRFIRKMNTDSVLARFEISPEFEKRLNELKQESDSEKYVAALFYKDLRNTIINSLIYGEKNNPNDSLHQIVLDSIYYNKVQKILGNIKSNPTGFSFSDVIQLYRIISSYMCFYTIKEELANENLIGLINTYDYYQTIEFLEEQLGTINMDFSIVANDNIKNVATRDLINGNIQAYSDFLQMICSNYIYVNQNHLEKIRSNQYAKLYDVLHAAEVINFDNYIRSILIKISKGKTYEQAERQTLNQLFSGMDSLIGRVDSLYLFYENKLSYRLLINSVLDTLIPIIQTSECKYNNYLIDICKQLVTIGACQGVDIENAMMVLKSIDKERIQDSYQVMEQYVDAIKLLQSSTSEVRELLQSTKSGMVEKNKNR